MSTFSQIPFNVDILQLGRRDLGLMLPVVSMDTFEGRTKDFNKEGLYSTTIFGVKGTADRRRRYSYIDLRAAVIHPALYKSLVAVRPLYGDILASRAFATWNPETNDFERSNAVEGRTGFHFFTTYLPDLEFPVNDTESRQDAVALLNKYRSEILMRHFIVIPAGFREYEMGDDGREQTNEINEYYLSLLAISNTINESTFRISPESFDTQRRSMQQKVIDLYDLFSQMIEGKQGVLVGKFLSRRIANGTRNVITSMNTVAARLGEDRNITINDTTAGLYQTARALAPLTFYQLRERFLSRAISFPGAPAKLCDPKTLQSTRVMLDSTENTRWLSMEGLEAFINNFSDETLRHKPIMIGGNYLGLTYRGPDKTFAFLSGIDELPADGSRLAEHCTPITYAELLYHALYPIARRHFAIVTRYPVTGVGSSYPSRIYLKSTLASEVRRELDPLSGWEPVFHPNAKVQEAVEFPVTGSPFFNAMSPHASHLGGLGADFDGDTASFTAVILEQSLAECEKYLLSKRAYVGTDGRLMHGTGTDTVNFVLASLTGK